MADREPPAEGRGRRGPPLRWVIPMAIAAPGIVLVAAASGVAQIVGGTLIAVALVVVVSLVFLEVGYSEDRARARGEEGLTARRPPRTRG